MTPEGQTREEREQAFLELIGTDYKGMKRQYPAGHFWRFSTPAAFVAFLITALLYWKGEPPLPIVKDLIEVLLSVIPNLLGFLLGGYAALIGFSNTDFVKMTMRANPESKHGVSYYQSLNSTFAGSILTLVYCLIVTVLFRLFSYVHLSPHSWWAQVTLQFKLLNLVAILLLAFGLLRALWFLLEVVMHIFNFAQVYHFSVRVDELERKKDMPKKR